MSSVVIILLCGLLFVLGICSFVISRQKNYKQIYIYRTITYIFFLSAIFLISIRYIDIESVIKSLETLTTISATIAGFVFSGISIIFALLNVEYINSLFKNNFLDKVFYKAYGVVALSLLNIGIYVMISQFNFNSINNIIITVYLYIFWMSILFYILMIYDFIKVIKRAKGRGK